VKLSRYLDIVMGGGCSTQAEVIVPYKHSLHDYEYESHLGA